MVILGIAKEIGGIRKLANGFTMIQPIMVFLTMIIVIHLGIDIVYGTEV